MTDVNDTGPAALLDGWERYLQKQKSRLPSLFAGDDSYVVVAREKQGCRYLDATTIERLAASCLCLLKERVGYGWYRPDALPSPPELDQDAIKSLPAGAVRDMAERQRDTYQLAVAERDTQASFLAVVEHIVAEGDGRAAYCLLIERAAHEYESVSLERLERGKS